MENTTNNYGITESMTRVQFEEYFHENREITYKNLTIGVMDWEDGRFDVLTPTEEAPGFKALNASPFSNACDAINFAINYLVEYDVNRNADGTKAAAGTKTTKEKAKKKDEPEYNGPRLVKVFGREIYTEEDPMATNEDIRKKLVSEYDFPNFKKGRVYFDLDSATGTLEVLLKFNTKG